MLYLALNSSMNVKKEDLENALLGLNSHRLINIIRDDPRWRPYSEEILKLET